MKIFGTYMSDGEMLINFFEQNDDLGHMTLEAALKFYTNRALLDGVKIESIVFAMSDEFEKNFKTSKQ